MKKKTIVLIFCWFIISIFNVSWSQVNLMKDNKSEGIETNYLFNYDIALNDTNITLINRLFKTSCNTISLHESNLYLNLKDTLVIINLQDLINPTIISRTPTDYQNIRKIIIRDNNAFIADWDGFYILDISNFDSLKEISSIQYTGRYTMALAIKDNYAFLGNFDGLHVINISDLLKPQEINLLGGAPVVDVVISDNYAYAASVYNGLRIIDISVPTNPNVVGSIITGSEALGITIKNNYAYLSNLENGLRVIDISNPSNPQEVGYFNTEGYTYDSFIQDKYAYVADGINGLLILDISVPSNPVKVAYSNYGGNATDLIVVNNIIYLADNNNGFYIFKNELITSVSTTNLKTIDNFSLKQNYPNPFNATTTIRYGIPLSVHVKITIYDISGKNIITLVDNQQNAGWYNVQWDSVTGKGKAVSSGVYLMRLEAGNFIDVKKILLMK